MSKKHHLTHFVPVTVLKILAIVLAIFTVIFWIYLAYLAYFYRGFFPNIYLDQTHLGGLSKIAAQQKLQTDYNKRLNQSLMVSYLDQNFSINLASSAATINFEPNLTAAYQVGRSGQLFNDVREQLSTLFFGRHFTSQLIYQKKVNLISQINQINQTLKKEPVNAQLNYAEQITISPSQDGYQLDENTFLKQIDNYLINNVSLPAQLPIVILKPAFSTQAAQQVKKALDFVQKTPLKLNFENNSWIIDQEILLNLLDLSGKVSENSLSPTPQDIGQNLPETPLYLQSKKLDDFINQIALIINQPTLDARFSFNTATKRVTEFQPAQAGKKLNQSNTKRLILQALIDGYHAEITLPVEITQPSITTEEVNSFGIEDLIGQGISNFAGSITNRIYNIGLATVRLNGMLVAPGETFSFNKVMGDISAASGYKQAYIIKEGRTILDDGGGVCQVSTTVFRAALNAGLPIIERTAHAYRVGYYEQGYPPGLDATVFAPSVDLKFKNDTASYLLIQSYIADKNLYVDIYGRSDDRITVLSKPIIANQTPPLPEIRQDDPTLPKGEVKQVDWPAWGANVSFTRVVTRGNEEIIKETWKSHYKSWQAIYLVGTR